MALTDIVICKNKVRRRVVFIIYWNNRVIKKFLSDLCNIMSVWRRLHQMIFKYSRLNLQLVSWYFF